MTSAGLIAAAALRVFSADFCADQFALALADRRDIAALSPEAGRDFSFLREEAFGLPQARPDAEQILARDADLVLRFWGGDQARFERLGVAVLTLSYANDFDDVAATIATAAEALGQSVRGEALIADMARRLERLAAGASRRPRALYVTPGGVTAGRGTMIDAIFSAAGLINIASESGLEGWPPLPLERLVADPPDLIVAGFFSASSEKADLWSAARHPAFDRLFAEARVIHLPADVLSCPAFFSVDAAEAIRRELETGPHAR